MFESAEAELGSLDEQFESGEFGSLLTWLQQNVHQHGCCYTGSELIEKATGKPLSSDHLMNYLENKFAPLFGI